MDFFNSYLIGAFKSEEIISFYLSSYLFSFPIIILKNHNYSMLTIIIFNIYVWITNLLQFKKLSYNCCKFHEDIEFQKLCFGE